MKLMNTMLAALSRRVEQDIAPQLRVRLQSYRFGDWLQQGSHAPAATVGQVEEVLDDLLESSYQVGSRWGYLIGVALGISCGLVVGLIAWLYAVIS